MPPMPTERSILRKGPEYVPRQNWIERRPTRAMKDCWSQRGRRHRRSVASSHWSERRSNALFWSAKKTLVDGAGGSEETASLMYLSTIPW